MVVPVAMSLYFDFYNEDGEVVASDVLMSSVILLCDYDNLNIIHKKFYEVYNHPMVVKNETWRYASPRHIMDYMFDIKTGELLPNRFLK